MSYMYDVYTSDLLLVLVHALEDVVASGLVHTMVHVLLPLLPHVCSTLIAPAIVYTPPTLHTVCRNHYEDNGILLSFL